MTHYGVYIKGSLQEKLKSPEIANNPTLLSAILQAIQHYNYEYRRAKQINTNGAIEAIFDLIKEEQENERPELTSKIQCRKGCSYCCHINVTISSDEANYIGNYCKKQNIQINKKYLRKQLHIAASDIGLSKVSACIFLKNNLCSIYDARPLACRSYLVFNDPIHCNLRANFNHRTEIYFNPNIEAMISAVWSNSLAIDRLPKLLLPYAK